jgi:hypothetical protein
MMTRTIHRSLIVIGLLVFALPIANGQDIPKVGQPTSGFYNAEGNSVRVEWKLDRLTVPEDEELIATLVVTGVANPKQVIRPDLSKLQPFEARFVIAGDPNPPPIIGAKEVRFIYHLRPRNRSVDRLPTLAFHYYNPAAAIGKQFPLTTAKEVRITVTAPRQKAEAHAIPLAEPEWLINFAPRPVSLSRPAIAATWSWLAIALAGPVAAMAWYFAWRRIYPDAARLAQMRRSRAARRANDLIRRSHRAPDPPTAVAAAVLGYLRARFPLPPAAVTPSELGTALAEVGLPHTDCLTVEGFFRASDAARFAAVEDNADSLSIDAIALVARLEAA